MVEISIIKFYIFLLPHNNDFCTQIKEIILWYWPRKILNYYSITKSSVMFTLRFAFVRDLNQNINLTSSLVLWDIFKIFSNYFNSRVYQSHFSLSSIPVISIFYLKHQLHLLFSATKASHTYAESVHSTHSSNLALHHPPSTPRAVSAEDITR